MLDHQINHEASKLIAATRVIEWANKSSKNGSIDSLALVEFLVNENNHTFDSRVVDSVHVIDGGQNRFYRPEIILWCNTLRNQSNFDLESLIARAKADAKFMEYFAKIEARGPHA